MNAMRARLIAIAAALALAALGSWGLDGDPEAIQEMRRWLSGSLDLALLAAGAWRARGRALRPSPPPASAGGGERDCECRRGA